MFDVIIIGGGIAGLVNAINLSKSGLLVLLVEKKKYPFHRVCGEYISNEVRDYLNSIHALPDRHELPNISRLQLSSTKGESITLPLDLGGFGVSRYTLDSFLYEKAQDSGAQFLLQTSVTNVKFLEDSFEVTLSNSHVKQSKIVIGSHGKRDKIDKQLSRNFIYKKSPFIGVKYHIEYDIPKDLIALHNFEGGYCGISNVEQNIVNLCYLSKRSNLKKYRDIRGMEMKHLSKNPLLRDIFNTARFIFDKPEVINEISFSRKQPIENHILMCGDAAGMITPLCGNGMAMAIHSAKILSEFTIDYFQRKGDRATLEHNYKKAWESQFSTRFWAGRKIQQLLFGTPFSSTLSVAIAQQVPSLAQALVKLTHGKPI